MLVGIIGAMSVEVAELLKTMEIAKTETISLVDFHVGKINGYDVVIAKCGPGKVNAAICAQTMCLKYSPDLIINTGVAGSLSSALDVGDCAIATSVVQYDVDTTAVGDPLGMVSGINVIEFSCDEKAVEKLKQAVESLEDTPFQLGMIATGDKFLNSREGKQQILDHFDAIACEMESGSIGHVCYQNQIPFCIIRSISDNADQTSCIDYVEFLGLAADKASSVVRLFLEKVNRHE